MNANEIETAIGKPSYTAITNKLILVITFSINFLIVSWVNKLSYIFKINIVFCLLLKIPNDSHYKSAELSWTKI